MANTSEQTGFLIPNSFQLPNGYVDRLMALLTPEEFKVLVYAARRIFGFGKHRDRISLSQFCDGTVNKDGERLDHGTGLNPKTVRDVLKMFVERGLMVRTADNDPRLNLGAEYALQLDPEKVRWEWFEHRAAQAAERAAKVSAAGRKVAAEKLAGVTPSHAMGGPTTAREDLPRDGRGVLPRDGRGVLPSDSNTKPSRNPDSTPAPAARASELNPVGSNPSRPKAESRQNAAPAKPASEHQRLMAEYHAALGYSIPNGKQEGAAARRLLAAGFTVEQVIACYRHLKAQTFWADKHLSLQTVHNQIAPWLQKHAPKVEIQQAYPEELRTFAEEWWSYEVHQREYFKSAGYVPKDFNPPRSVVSEASRPTWAH